MAGIRGRSKACGLCYQRRIKCDEARPACKRCRKSKLSCPGYRDTTFLSYQAGPKGLRRLQDDAIEGQRQQVLSLSTNDLWKSLYQPTVCSQDEIYIMYSRAHLPSEWNKDRQWQLTSPSLIGLDSHILQFALLALARTLFGYHHDSRNLIVQGLKSYGQVLANVQRLLQDPETAARIEVLETILALRAFDSFMPFQPQAWIQHSIGIESLLHRAGPLRFTSVDSQRVLEHARPQIIMACLALGKSTILAQEQWKTLPWLEHQSHDPAHKALIDIFADLPTMTKRSSSGDVDKSFRHDDNIEVGSLASNILRRLQWWLAGWSQIQPQADVEAQNPTSRYIYQLRLETRTLVLYCAICLLVLDRAFRPELESIHCTHCIQQNAAVPLSPASLIPKGTQVLSPVDVKRLYHHALAEACRSVMYYLKCEGESSRLVDILIPLRQKLSKQPVPGIPLFIHAKYGTAWKYENEF